MAKNGVDVEPLAVHDAVNPELAVLCADSKFIVVIFTEGNDMFIVPRLFEKDAKLSNATAAEKIVVVHDAILIIRSFSFLRAYRAALSASLRSSSTRSFSVRRERSMA